MSHKRKDIMKTSELDNIKRRYFIVGMNEGLNHAIDTAIKVAPVELSVLIQGESGVGKEVIPRLIHENSKRKHEQYIAINCGSIPEGTIDSELFGHEKGAYTGAISEHDGYFAKVDKGTIFLDEVGELPLSTQARLLRVLETGEYIRVGSSDVRKTNVRVIAATNVNLQKAISEGKFREDLYYRLASVPIFLPPLRERGNDIILLFRKFARDFTSEYHLPDVELTDEAANLLKHYKWPGNIRELKNVAGRVCLMTNSTTITAETLLQFGITDDTSSGTGIMAINQNTSRHSYENEREMLFQVLTTLNKEVKELKEMMNKQAERKTEAMSDTAVINYGQQPQIIQQAPTQRIVNIEPGLCNIPTIETIEETKQLTMREVEEQQIREALLRNHGNRGRTATELGISERTLYRKIKEYNITVTK